MSVLRIVDVQCDWCQKRLRMPMRGTKGHKVREAAKFMGWHINLPGGSDMCLECWESGKRPETGRYAYVEEENRRA